MSSLLGLLALLTPLLDLERTVIVPPIGEHTLRVLTPRLLELHLVNTQSFPEEGETTSPTTWDFLELDQRKATAPSIESFLVEADGDPISVVGIGFKRLPFYAPLNEFDLRVGNSIFLLLDEGVPPEASVTVTDAPEDAADYLTDLTFVSESVAERVSSAIHVSQVGFEPSYESGLPSVKQGFVSLYLGDLGVTRVDEASGEWVVDLLEDGATGAFSGQSFPLGLDTASGFEIVDAMDGRVAHTGQFTQRADERWLTYRSVLEADFSDVVDPGWYRLRIPGMGASLPFGIHEGVASTLARTLALGVFHQRSNQDHALPFTRFVDGPAHSAPAFMPFDDVQEFPSYSLMERESNSFFEREDTVHPAPQIRDANTMLYPYVGDIIAWWPMDEAEGLRDLSSHRLHGQRFGGLGQAESSGKVNGALQFDGVDDYARVDALPSLNGAKEMSMSFWLRLDNLDQEQVVFSKGTGWECRYDPVTKGLLSKVGGVNAPAPWRVVGDGDWHFIMMRFEADSPRGIAWFVDHKAAGEAASTLGMATFPDGGASPFIVGNGNALDTNTFLHGTMDDLRLRESIVTGEELLETSQGNGPWVDVSGGHFDAGDYSKYMKNSGLFVHTLAFMIDQVFEIDGTMPQPFDHLGLPESGDGISDLMQEAKWEADYIAKMQDTDGGFFSMVNPRERRFEDDVLPSEGDRQVVWPKTLIATGVAVGALAELGRSPAFRAVYPGEAARYREKALLGWDFIEAAVAEHGVLGGHQRIFHYGEKFDANDEIAYAAAALFAMTGESKYEARLIEWMPYDSNLIPNNNIVEGWRGFRRFTWQRLHDSVGAAMRVYAFSDRGVFRDQDRVFASDLIVGKRYFDHVFEEIVGAGDDQVARAQGSPFGASVPLASKRFGAVNYFFGGAEAFDLIGANLLAPKPEYERTILSNVSYQAGGNPVNVSFLSGLGWVNPRNIVSQWALNDERQLPPSGFTSGSVNSGMPFLNRYGSLLGKLGYPPLTHESSYAVPHGTYHRYADSFDVSNEFVILDHGRSLATMSYLMAAANDHMQAWEAPPAVSIIGLPGSVQVGTPVALEVQCEQDLSRATVLWEASRSEPRRGSTFSLLPKVAGTAWVELEVLWPDGRRSFARETIVARASVLTAYVENFQPAVTQSGTSPHRKILANPNVIRYYPLDGSLADSDSIDQSLLSLSGNAAFEPSLFDYPGYETVRPDYQSLRFQGAGDALEVVYHQDDAIFPADSDWVSLEAMIYIESYEKGIGAPDFLALMTNSETRLRLGRSRWDDISKLQLDYGESTALEDPLPLQQWVHLRVVHAKTAAHVLMDGVRVLSVPSDRFGAWLDPLTTPSLHIGHFRGWVSDIILKAGSGELETVDAIKEIVPGAPHFTVDREGRLDSTDTWTPSITITGPTEGLSYAWSGPDGVVFDSKDIRNPSVTFLGAGDYELLLTVTGTNGVARVERVWLNVRNLIGNVAPKVDAGPPHAITLPSTWQPQPTVSDDGSPENTLDSEWTQVSGPAPATIDDPLSLTPEIRFDKRGLYIFELTADDAHAQTTDQVAIVVQDELRELVPGEPFATDAETVALYHFDGDFQDSSGNGFHLTPEGAPAFSNNVAWMATPAGQSVAFSALGQQLVANLSGIGDSFTMEWRYLPEENLSYSVTGVPVVGLDQNHNARLNYFHHKWTLPKTGSVDLAANTVASAELLEPYLSQGIWVDMKMLYGASGQFTMFINGQSIADRSGILAIDPEGSWILTLGNFKGLIDEVRISRNTRMIIPPNRAPLVAMETRRAIEEPSTVTPLPPAIIDDEETFTYAWSVVSGDASRVTFADASALDSSINFLDKGVFALNLTVNDGQLATETTSVWTVGKNTPPVIRAETKEATLAFGTAFEPEVVIEDDAWPDANELTTNWKVIQGDASNVTFSDSSARQPTVSFTEAGDYTLRLEVSDGEFVSDVDFQITVLPKLLPPVIRNQEPQASLRLDNTFTPSIEIEGDGPFTFEWTITLGLSNNVSFSDATTLNPTVQFAAIGEYELTIQASARDEFTTSTVRISVLPNLLPPVIRNEEPMVSMQLDGTFTPELAIEGDGPFTFQWTVTRGLTDRVVFSDPTTLNPSIEFTQIGDYDLTIQASARDEQASSQIQISVLPVPTPLESWRTKHFLAETLDDPSLEASVWGNLADPDGDGRVNLLEAYAGTDPREPNLSPFLRIRQMDNTIVLKWSRAQDPLGLSAEVLTSPTLENFEPLEPVPVITVAANQGDIEARMPLDQAKRFLALSISPTQ